MTADAAHGTAPGVDPGPAAADPPERPGSRGRELAIAAGVAAIGIGIVVAAAQLPAPPAGSAFGPGWWPTVLGGALVLGALVVAAAGLVRPSALEDAITVHGLLRLLTVLGLVVGFGFAWYQLHFLIVMPPLLAALVAVTGGRGVRDLVVVPILTAALLYGVFGLLLQVPL